MEHPIEHYASDKHSPAAMTFKSVISYQNFDNQNLLNQSLINHRVISIDNIYYSGKTTSLTIFGTPVFLKQLLQSAKENFEALRLVSEGRDNTHHHALLQELNEQAFVLDNTFAKLYEEALGLEYRETKDACIPDWEDEVVNSKLREYLGSDYETFVAMTTSMRTDLQAITLSLEGLSRAKSVPTALRRAFRTQQYWKRKSTQVECHLDLARTQNNVLSAILSNVEAASSNFHCIRSAVDCVERASSGGLSSNSDSFSGVSVQTEVRRS